MKKQLFPLLALMAFALFTLLAAAADDSIFQNAVRLRRQALLSTLKFKYTDATPEEFEQGVYVRQRKPPHLILGRLTTLSDRFAWMLSESVFIKSV